MNKKLRLIALSLIAILAHSTPVRAGVAEIRADHLSCSAEPWPGQSGFDYIVSGRAINKGSESIADFAVSVRIFSPDQKEILLTSAAGDYISGRIMPHQTFRFNAVVNVMNSRDIPSEYKRARLPAKVSFGWPDVDGPEFGPVGCPPTNQ